MPPRIRPAWRIWPATSPMSSRPATIRCPGACSSGYNPCSRWPSAPPTSPLAAKRRSLDRQLGAILTTPSRCDLTRDLQAKIGRARDQLLVFLAHPGQVALTNNGSERLLRPAVVQRKVTNGYRAMWAASGEAGIRTVVDTARLSGASPFDTILKTIRA
jgi:transposase